MAELLGERGSKKKHNSNTNNRKKSKLVSKIPRLSGYLTKADDGVKVEGTASEPGTRSRKKNSVIVPQILG